MRDMMGDAVTVLPPLNFIRRLKMIYHSLDLVLCFSFFRGKGEKKGCHPIDVYYGPPV
jgi:hypothetical protein